MSTRGAKPALKFQVQGNDGHRVEVVLARLFDSKLGNYFVLISNLRSWKSWFWKTESPDRRSCPEGEWLVHVSWV